MADVASEPFLPNFINICRNMSEQNPNYEIMVKNLWDFMASFFPDPMRPMIAKYNPNILKHLINKVGDIMSMEPQTIQIPMQAVVVGPLYGQGDSFVTLMSLAGMPPTKTYVFLGGYMGKGFAQVEVFFCILCLKALFPTNVYLLRGHFEECASLQALGVDRFLYDRGLGERECVELRDQITKMCGQMPLACLMGTQILCLPGGPGPCLRKKGLDFLVKLPKRLQEKDHLVVAMIPRKTVKSFPELFPRYCTRISKDLIQTKNLILDELTFENEHREAIWSVLASADCKTNDGVPTFTDAEVSKFCSDNKLSLIVRGRQMVDGYLNYPAEVITLFSAVSYLDTFNNSSAALSFSGTNGQIIRYRMAEVEPKTCDIIKPGMGRNAP